MKTFDACEQALFTLIETSYEQEAWRNKGFLLLVSTYLGMNDLFQARATAESILANVKHPIGSRGRVRPSPDHRRTGGGRTRSDCTA